MKPKIGDKTLSLPLAIEGNHSADGSNEKFRIYSGLLLCGIVMFYDIIVVMEDRMNIIGDILLLSISFFVIQKLIRVLVFNEAKLFKKYKQGNFADIDEILKKQYIKTMNDNFTYVQYDNNIIGVLLEFHYDSILGKTETDEFLHYQSIEEALHTLLTDTFVRISLNVFETSRKLYSLRRIFMDCKISSMKKLISALINYYEAGMVSYAKKDYYYLYYNLNFVSLDKVKYNVNKFSNAMYSANFKSIDICGEDEILDVFGRYYGINNLTMTDMAKTSNKEYKHIFVIDENK